MKDHPYYISSGCQYCNSGCYLCGERELTFEELLDQNQITYGPITKEQHTHNEIMRSLYNAAYGPMITKQLKSTALFFKSVEKSN